MKKYEYIAIGVSGEKDKGLMYAQSKEAVVQKLKKQNKVVLSINEQAQKSWHFWDKPVLSFEDKMLLTKNLSTMVNVGMTLSESLEILKEQDKRKSIQKMYDSIIKMIQSGQTLAKSLKQFKHIFSEIFINMIQVGEKSGNLDKVLGYLDTQLEKEYELRKRVLDALIYPIIIIAITVIMGFAIMFFIMPKITQVFEGAEDKLPISTKILVASSEYLQSNPILVLVVTALIIIGMINVFRLKALKPVWHMVLLYIPIFGNLMINANLARFARTMNSLLQAGIPITEALQITADVIGHNQYRKAILLAKNKIEQGAHLGESLQSNERLFPLLATKMIHVGETSGNLETTTEHLAQLYEQKVESITKRLSVVLEPVLLLIMGFLVGGTAISIILPIYKMQDLVT